MAVFTVGAVSGPARGRGFRYPRSQQAEHAPWAPRSPPSVVFQDKLWLYSGKHTGADDSWGGDIWTLSAPSREDAARADPPRR